MHFNCHNQELVPFGPAGVRTFIEALLIAGASAEDALAASFCLCRCEGLKYQVNMCASARNALAASFCLCNFVGFRR